MARPERVAFGLSLAPSSSELMGPRITPLESFSPPESMTSLSYFSLSLLSVSLLSALALLSFCVLAFVSVCQLREDSPAAGMNALQLPLLSYSCCSSNAASARGGLSNCLVLEHVN